MERTEYASPSNEMIHSDLIQELEQIRKENEILKKKNTDLEVLLESIREHSDFIIDDIISELTTTKKTFLDEINKYVIEISGLQDQLSSIKKEKADLEMMMEMAANHADGVGEELLGKINSYEQQCRIITETIPVPILITKVSNGQVIYANHPASVLFGVPLETLIGRKTTEFYDQSDRERLKKLIERQGYFKDQEIHGHTSDGKPFVAELSAKPILFDDQDCFLSVWYDITERKKAEEEIRKLHQEIEDAKEREDKYLFFKVANHDYGVHLLSVKEILGNLPITPVPDLPVYIKGMALVRNRLIPVADMKILFGFGSGANNSDNSCIIVSESETTTFGMAVDSVSEILSIKNKDIDPPPVGLNSEMEFISGMAKIGDTIRILIEVGQLLSGFPRKSLLKQLQV